MKDIEIKPRVKLAPNTYSIEKGTANLSYEPILRVAEDFKVSSVFNCSDAMKQYSGYDDYHSLMHSVQKPFLTTNKVEALSFFANKLLLQEWLEGLVPLQKTFSFSTTLNEEVEIKRLFQVVTSKIKALEEFIIKPINGSESIGTLKVYLYQGKLQSKFLRSQKASSINFKSNEVISDFETFKHWVTNNIIGVTSGNIDTHLRHIKPGLMIQALFPHDSTELGPIEMKFNTAWGDLLYVGCRNTDEISLGSQGEHLEGNKEIANKLQDIFFEKLKKIALSIARASTFPNLRIDFFVDLKSGEWVLNEIETLADCRSYPNYVLENTGKFFLRGWLSNAFSVFESELTVAILRERLYNELVKMECPTLYE